MGADIRYDTVHKSLLPVGVPRRVHTALLLLQYMIMYRVEIIMGKLGASVGCYGKAWSTPHARTPWWSSG